MGVSKARAGRREKLESGGMLTTANVVLMACDYQARKLIGFMLRSDTSSPQLVAVAMRPPARSAGVPEWDSQT